MSSSYLPATTDSIANALEARNPSEAITILYQVIDDPSSSSEALRIKEQAITNLYDLLREQNRAQDLCNLLTQSRPFFLLIPKAKTAKIVRGFIDSVAKIPGTSNIQITLCMEMVQWTRDEKRIFLRQRVEARLAALLMENKEYSEAQQGTIVLQSGILHAEEKDYKTVYSYFFEAFEAFNALQDPRAVFSLKYMLLCKIMVSQADDVAGIISSKAGLQYLGPELDAMKAVADLEVI